MSKIDEALDILKQLDFPRAQLNDRSALTLLALVNLQPNCSWQSLSKPIIGIRAVLDFCRDIYTKPYAENTRETFRRQTMHQFVASGLVVENPDKADRPKNSPKWCYQIETEAYQLLLKYGTPSWDKEFKNYSSKRQSLVAQYANQRDMQLIPCQMPDGEVISLSIGKHSQLIHDIIQEFAPRYAPNSKVIYVGDTGDKWAYFKKDRLAELGIEVDIHGKMPDVILFYVERNWLLLVEAVTSHGPVDGKRHLELANMFGSSTAGLVYVTAFPDRRAMSKYIAEIAWETEVWTADAPTHLIHFNGDRFLGPYLPVMGIMLGKDQM